MDLSQDGAERYCQALSDDERALLEELADRYRNTGPGKRLFGDPLLRQLLAPTSSLQGIARRHLGCRVIPVRAILFDKHAGSNWSLGWHQDRTIAVRAQREVLGFDVWTVKSGIVHVEPPFQFIAEMVTLRAHLDDCFDDNAPLTIIPGSHTMGRITVDRIDGIVSVSTPFICTAAAGDVWVFSSAILHASDAAHNPSRRRVLHVDYSIAALPGGLEWLGV